MLEQSASTRASTLFRSFERNCRGKFDYFTNGLRAHLYISEFVMRKSSYACCVGPIACAFAVLFTGCGSDTSRPNVGSGAATPVGEGGASPSNGARLPPGGSGGSFASGGSLGDSGGGSGADWGIAGKNLGGGATTASAGAGGATLGSGGAAGNGSGGAPVGSGGLAAGGGSAARTVELIGPAPSTCGATNATHGDGFVCVLNYPSAGPNVVGYWFDYPFVAGTCNLKMTKPSGNNDANPKMCFSASDCPATSGGGLGVALCDVHGIDVSTWPQLAELETAATLSPTAKSPFGGCNPGATLTGVSWTLGSGSIPAGMSILFDDASDKNVARLDVPAGTSSLDLPANVDTSKVASIKFSASGGNSASWNFCLTSVKVSMR